MKRVLVTGAAGFIGSNLTQRCLNEGWQVDGVDNLSNGHTEFLPKEACFWHADFSSDYILSLVKMQRYDVVFHLAAVPRVSYSVEHPIETNETNVTKTLKLIEASRGNVGRFVFASSSSVYGGADVLPTAETCVKDPKSPYALQKSIIEDYLSLYDSLYNLDSASMRFFNVFGPNALGSSPYATALSAWLTCIKKNVPMRSDGDGTQSRDLCYVDNVTEACVLAAKKKEKLGSERFNVACGSRTTNSAISAYLMKRYPSASMISAPWRQGDVMHTHADITKSENVLGYKPLFTAEQGIELTCDWYDNNWDRIRDFTLSV